ncbi:hypothetical protein BO443_220010 [Burkholderia orbicola]
MINAAYQFSKDIYEYDLRQTSTLSYASH